MLKFVIGVIPYMVMGYVMGDLGVGLSDWHWWAILGCMFASEIITLVKCKLED